jgi:peptide/nickel transport system permease protein
VSIAIRHVLPNAMTPGFAQASITFGYSIIITAGLSFIGAGVQPPTPEWGSMIAAGKDGIIIGQWWTSVFPGIAMSACVFGFAVVGEAVQDIFLRRT